MTDPKDTSMEKIHKALDLIINLQDFQSGLMHSQKMDDIIDTAFDSMLRIRQFEQMAIMFCDENNHFELSFCRPNDYFEQLKDEINIQIDRDIFSWALESNQAINTQSHSLGKQLIFSIIRTVNKVQGVFIGVCHDEQELTELEKKLFSIASHNIGQLIESHHVCHSMNNHSHNLELQIANNSKELQNTLKKLKAADTAKSNFLALMSHEIKTPMNAVNGMSSVLLNTKLDKEQTECVKVIQESTDHLMSIVNDILDFNMADSGNMRITKSKLDLRKIIEDVVKQLYQTAKEKSLELIINYPLQMHTEFIGDRARIKQILLNLVSNAIKFTDIGFVMIEVHVSENKDFVSEVQIRVIDTGIGIEEAKKAKIFNAFTQLDELTTRENGGTGLGLSLCKKLVNLMRGEIGLVSNKNRGSTFWFSIPLENDNEVKDEIDLDGMNFIVCDENPLASPCWTELLKGSGAGKVDTVISNEFLKTLIEESFKKDPCNIAIINQPVNKNFGLNVKELARSVSKDPSLRECKLILLSSSELDSDEVKELEESGYYNIIPKPWRLKELMHTIEVIKDKIEIATRTQIQLERKPFDECEEFGADVLIIEDNLINVKVAKSLLLKLGCKVEHAANGAEGLNKLKQKTYDMVFMDCFMPIMDGYETTQKFRDYEAENRKDRSLIIALTADSREDNRNRCLEVGMDDFISKPISIEKVKDILNKHLPMDDDFEFTINDDRLKLDEKTKDSPEPDAVFDKQHMLTLFDGQEHLVSELIDEFISLLDKNIPQLGKKILNKDFNAVKESCYKLRGAALILHAHPLIDVIKILENSIEDDVTEQINSAYIALESEVNRFRESVKQ